MRTEFKLAEYVYVSTDPDQFKRMIIEIRQNFNGYLYVLSLGPDTTLHYAEELTRERTLQI